MSIEIGTTTEGTVVKLANYGAIVRLQGGKMGLIHISEIVDTFVRDINDYFKENDRVLVKVLSVNDKGRYELSTKHIDQPKREPVQVLPKKKPAPRPPDVVYLGPDPFLFTTQTPVHAPFEDRMTRFMKDSQERATDIKRNMEAKRGMKRR